MKIVSEHRESPSEVKIWSQGPERLSRLRHPVSSRTLRFTSYSWSYSIESKATGQKRAVWIDMGNVTLGDAEQK